MDYKELHKVLEGVAVTHTTPFKENGTSVNVEGLRKHVRFLVDNGIKVVVTNGNTGEFYSLTLAECRRVLEEVVAEVGDEAVVVAGVGYDQETAADLARHAQETGAHAVMVHNPVHPYQTGPGVTAYYDRIIESVDIGIVPYVRNPIIDIKVLAHIAEYPNVVGCKYATNDLQTLTQIVRALPGDQVGMAWICGTAEAWAPYYFTAGARGFTSGLANVAPAKSLAMLDALQGDDHQRAMDLWAQIRPFEELRARYASGLNVSVVKAAMDLAGMESGGVRAPIAPISAEETEELREILKGLDVL